MCCENASFASRVNLKSNMHRFDEIADRFEQLSMYFMTFHGQENVKKVIEVSYTTTVLFPLSFLIWLFSSLR